MTGPREGGIPRLAWRLPGLARRSRLAAIVAAGPHLKVTVRYQERRYRGQIDHPGAGWKWRCPHKHLTHASASQCARGMARRIHRVGWQRATRRQSSTRGHEAGPADGTHCAVSQAGLPSSATSAASSSGQMASAVSRRSSPKTRRISPGPASAVCRRR
jgi:hypothetical protein